MKLNLSGILLVVLTFISFVLPILSGVLICNYRITHKHREKEKQRETEKNKVRESERKRKKEQERKRDKGRDEKRDEKRDKERERAALVKQYRYQII